MSFCVSILLAFLLDRCIGWPDWLYQRASHPVVWIGKIISFFDSRFNNPNHSQQNRRLFGILMIVATIAAVGSISISISLVLPEGVWGIVIGALLAWPFLASKSLYDHVMAVAKPLSAGDIIAARKAVSMIVGRDPDMMDSGDISRASLESLAENTSDGIIAPLFWGVVFGLPGLVIYKAINTADSMVGYKNERYLDFGWASARLDDVVNLIPARMTGALYTALAADRRSAFQIMRRDAGNHRSPNAGWPEAALAASLGIRLSGPRLYDGALTDDSYVNADGREPTARDIAIGLSRYNAVLITTALLLFALSLVIA